MNDSTADSPPRSPEELPVQHESTPNQSADRNRMLVLAAMALAIACYAVSSQSIWIDEAASALKAVQPTFSSWRHLMYLEGGSDKQMPLYMFWLWASQGILPYSEWGLRAAGIPFFIAGLAIFARNRIERWIVVILSAFTWYCLDEARPYAMQLGTSLACFGSLEVLAGNLSPRSERIWLGVFLLSLVLLAGSSLLGMVWSAAFLGAFVASQTNPARLWRVLVEYAAFWILAGLLLTGLAAYYLWAIRSSGPTAAGTTSWQNVVFAMSEVFGFTGLGPGRLELRAAGAGALRPYILPLLCIAAPTTIVAVTGLWRERKFLASRRGISLAVLVGGALAILLAIGVLKHFRVLGRHCTPIIPVVFWILAVGISTLWQSRKLVQRTIVILFLIAAAASSLSFRLAARHAKDNYRSTATLAQAAVDQGQMVWWAADYNAAALYGLSLPKGTLQQVLAKVEPGEAVLIWSVSQERLSALPVPQFVFASKPDLYDALGALAQFLKEHRYRLIARMPAFEIWQSPDAAGGLPNVDTQSAGLRQ